MPNPFRHYNKKKGGVDLICSISLCQLIESELGKKMVVAIFFLVSECSSSKFLAIVSKDPW